MKVTAQFQSVQTGMGLKTFRFDTALHSVRGEGDTIGLVYMLNPGTARPQDENICNLLSSSVYKTLNPVDVNKDPTLDKVISLIKRAFDYNQMTLPSKYTIHVENLFNLCEEKSKLAKVLSSKLNDAKSLELMYKYRKFDFAYKFVWLAWGKTNVNLSRQKLIKNTFPNHISVNKRTISGGKIQITDYPNHPLYMKTDFFLEATKGKLN